MTNKVQKIREGVERLMNELIQEKEKGFGSDTDDACILELQNVLTYIDSLKEEPVSEELDEAAKEYSGKSSHPLNNAFKAGAKWQREQINEALLSEVLPCFMHGGEADEVVAKLDEVLNQKK